MDSHVVLNLNKHETLSLCLVSYNNSPQSSTSHRFGGVYYWTLIKRQFSESNPYNLPNYTHYFLSLRYETDAHKNITLQPRFLLPDNYVKGTVRISHSFKQEALHDHHLLHCRSPATHPEGSSSRRRV